MGRLDLDLFTCDGDVNGLDLDLFTCDGDVDGVAADLDRSELDPEDPVPGVHHLARDRPLLRT